MARITPPSYIISADMLDRAEGTITADVSAAVAHSKTDTDQFHFYCSACRQKGQYTRLVPVKNQSKPVSLFNAPKRYRLFDRKSATHQCDQPGRYRALSALAHRYNAGEVEPGQYIFSDEVSQGQRPTIIDREIKTVDRASRLASIAYLLMYDQGLMVEQRLSMQGVTRPFREAFFDASKQDKMAIFKKAISYSRRQETFQSAVLFHSNSNRAQWKRYASNQCIPANIGPNVEMDGAKLRTVNMVWCADNDLYRRVKNLAFPSRTSKARPLLVMGDVMMNMRNFERACDKSKETGRAETVYTVIKVTEPSQVTLWGHDMSFEQAAANQDDVQQAVQPKIAQRAFAL